MNNPVSWFEIPCKDLDRAKNFFQTVFEYQFSEINMPDNTRMLMFPGGEGKNFATGALTSGTPNENGTLIYFEVDDVAHEAKKVEKAGGKLLFPKTEIGQFGFIAHLIDSEGNKIGLHSHR